MTEEKTQNNSEEEEIRENIMAYILATLEVYEQMNERDLGTGDKKPEQKVTIDVHDCSP